MEHISKDLPGADMVDVVTQYGQCVQAFWPATSFLELSDEDAGRRIKEAISHAIASGQGDDRVKAWLERGSYGGG